MTRYLTSCSFRKVTVLIATGLCSKEVLNSITKYSQSEVRGKEVSYCYDLSSLVIFLPNGLIAPIEASHCS